MKNITGKTHYTYAVQGILGAIALVFCIAPLHVAEAITVRCELEISDKRIQQGEEVILSWDTSNARRVIISDDNGEVFVDTDNFLAGEKEDFFDGELTVKPSEDTMYMLLAERGSADAECEVEVRVDETALISNVASNNQDVLMFQYREQLPVASGIYLAQLPYTGFDASLALRYAFYGIAGLWLVYLTYFVTLRRRQV